MAGRQSCGNWRLAARSAECRVPSAEHRLVPSCFRAFVPPLRRFVAPSLRPFAYFLLLPLLLTGCGRPSAANIELRKQNQALDTKVASLNQELNAARARIAGLEQSSGTVPTLPQARLDMLFTVHKVDIGRLSGGADLARDGGFDEGLKLYLTPVDAAGDPLKATGKVIVCAFDLGNPPVLLGEWTFTADQLKQQWVGFRIIYSFVLELPWQKVPPSSPIVVKVTFEDALTGRVLEAVQEVKANPPPVAPTSATTRP